MTLAELTTFVTTPEFFSGVLFGVGTRQGVKFIKNTISKTKVENNG